MLLRLLSFFPCIQRLLQDVSEAQREKLILQDRLDSALSDRERVWKEMQIAREGELAALHTLINIEYQQRYGVAPYPDAVKLPPAKDSGGPVKPRLTASQAIDAQIERVIQELTTRRQ